MWSYFTVILPHKLLSKHALLLGEKCGVFHRILPVLASFALHHEVIRVVRHFTLAIPSHTNDAIRQAIPHYITSKETVRTDEHHMTKG